MSLLTGRSRIRTATLALALATAIAAAMGAAVIVTTSKHPVARAEPMDKGASARTAVPTRPPAAMCGAPALAGPRSAPSGAVVVKPDKDLARVTANRRAGTTFWLAPGTHHLGPGRYYNVTPKPGNTYVGAPGAVLDGRNENLYAFTGHAASVTIAHLTIQNFGSPGDNNNEGVVNHDSARGWRILRSTIENNAGAGLMLGSRNVIRSNCIRGNGQYGFNAYRPTGVRNVTLHHNEIAGNNTDDWETRQPGCGCTGGGKFWETAGAVITDNWIHDNRSVGLWADTNNVGFLIKGNLVSDNWNVGFMYEISYNASVRGNRFVRNGLVTGPTNPGFPTGAIYLSESGSDGRVPGAFGHRMQIAGNVFRDNWGGVVLWENADRFCGSPANTSSGYCTLVNPKVATRSACSTPSLVSTDPYFGDCRWKTKNVLVRDNRFVFDPDRIGPECTKANICGFNGVFSNYGTYPDWSPYQGTIVERNITFRQNNLFRDNTYVGPWRFMAREAGNTVSWTRWRGPVLSQDAGSSRG